MQKYITTFVGVERWHFETESKDHHQSTCFLKIAELLPDQRSIAVCIPEGFRSEGWRRFQHFIPQDVNNLRDQSFRNTRAALPQYPDDKPPAPFLYHPHSQRNTSIPWQDPHKTINIFHPVSPKAP